MLSRQGRLPQQRARARTRADGLDAWLTGLSQDELLALLREQVDQDRNVRRRLELRAAGARGDLAEVRTCVRELLDIGPFAQHGYVEYADARAYGEQAEQAVSAITALTAAGRAGDAIDLSREALRHLAETHEQVDDSDGLLGEVAAGLAEAHLDACVAARPDPDDTARWLVGQALGDLGDLIDIDPFDYEDVLGPQGLATLRESAMAAWRDNRTGWAEKYLVERLAKKGGDVDAVIAVHAAYLAPDGSTHLTIARELDAVGRQGEALSWAERGLAEAPGSADMSDRSLDLIDYLCTRYAQARSLSRSSSTTRTSMPPGRPRPEPEPTTLSGSPSPTSPAPPGPPTHSVCTCGWPSS
ncbi:hypothetical protein [Streptomyces roseoverticillatus]|uniref:hypothetical protein n=1 Tax=Streptomyces roseoverticillatus TaxID=66429 RepID=UPI000AF1BEA9|nr:hypothetical protein [Streptomyces roseoverticillatus]